MTLLDKRKERRGERKRGEGENERSEEERQKKEGEREREKSLEALNAHMSDVGQEKAFDCKTRAHFSLSLLLLSLFLTSLVLSLSSLLSLSPLLSFLLYSRVKTDL